MFGGDDEDGDFLSPTGGAKLASLFGMDQAASHGNESFQYTAPKQPRKNSNPVPSAQKPAVPPGAPAVVFATAVQAFRYINGQYVKQGKLGAAVLGTHTTKEYKLLLYMSQQKQVTTAKIHVGFVFTLQPNNYCTFYDDQRQNWSLMFESEKASTDFCKEVCLAKANSAPSLDSVVVQELSLGEGQAVENGDSLEVGYTGWLLQNHTFGQVFDSSQSKDKLLRLKLGAGKVIKGWEEGLLGMKKTGRRLMVIPPNLAYGSKGVANRIPAHSTLIFETEIRRVKFAKDSGSDRASASSRDSAATSPAPSPAPSVENLASELPAQTTGSGPGRPGEPPLRAKSNSLSEQLANPDATKAKLISRMAKMGQPMLPFLTGVASQPESSDSELEDTSLSRAKDRPAAPSPVQISSAASSSAQVHPQPQTAPPSALIPVLTAVAPQPGMPGTTHAFQSSVAPSQLQPVGQVYPAQTVPYMGSSDVTSFLMTEARQHNTEIRLAVGKVADKVDQLASKMDDLQRQGNLSMGMSSLSMETSMIMHNIQRIVQENECLKKEVFEKSSRIEEQNHKIGELINQNQRYVEQSNLLLEQRNDSLKSSSEQNQARLLQAEQDKHALPEELGLGQVRLTEDLASSTARLSQLQLEASCHQQKAVDLQTKLTSALQDSENHCQRISALDTQLEELKEAADRAQTQYRSEKQKRKETELRVSNMEEELQDLKTDKEGLESMLSDRKRKWQAERQRRDEEVEELRKSSQQELDNLRAQLRKARTSTNNAASQQLSQLQAELEQEWKGKCEQALSAAKEQHGREMADLSEQRDALEHKLLQLQDKLTALKQARDSEDQRGQTEELQVLQQKYTGLEQQSVAVKQKLERRVAELEKRLEEQENTGDTAGEVKRVMNGVFHSLRGEFDLSESYSGQAVLAVIVSTIKNVTLQLLNGTERPLPQQSQRDEEEEEEESDVKETEEKHKQNVHVNGEKKEEEEEEEEEGKEKVEVQKVESESVQVGDAQTDQEVSQEVAIEKETPVASVSVTQSQPEPVEATDPSPASSSEVKPPEAMATDWKVQQEQEAHSTPEASPEVKDSSEASAVADGPEESPDSQRQQEPRSEGEPAASFEVDQVSMDVADPLGETNAMSHKVSGPPTNPPPPPNRLQDGTGKVTSLTGGVGEENGEEPFFHVPAPTKPPPPPSEEEEEDELSLKGCPPPAPLFGEEDDDDDLDWLS
ncbi:FK506-binding protein 15 isoform X2 [Myripristis murdjan]|uniref:FK506-binding protein 15 isoform X2 n=1 Tax=Myripristis murdjan TaxID=586833 RepID=UPI001175EF63|nr:FK506-binding protein 15 isoform X2 [Myripristis murdjan]